MNISKRKLALFLVIAFFVGGALGTGGSSTKTEITDTQKDQIEWVDLMRLDDKIITNLNKSISACGVEDIIRCDKLTEEYQFLISERNLILEKLGH